MNKKQETIDTKHLKVLFINDRGLKSKINLNILQDFVNDFDIICFAETLSNSFRSSEFEDFEVFTGTNRERLKEFHGLAVLVKKRLAPKFIEGSMGLWSKILINEKNYCFSVVYFPCENSKNWDGDLFSELSDDIANMKVGGNEIFKLGDFSARTDHLTDHVNLEESATNVPMRHKGCQNQYK